MDIRQRYQYVIDYFSVNMKSAQTELVYGNPFELLVAVILSAQCTDKRVNQITPGLFARFPDVWSMAKSSPDEIFDYIRSCSYPNSKAKHIYEMSVMLAEKYGGEVPSELDELVTLPGVGRKTANVMLAVVFNKPTMAVDTHVFRVSARIGLTEDAKNPLQAERQLVSHFPEEVIPSAHHWLILHGRYVCLARKPKCEVCGLTQCCKYFSERK